MIFCNLGSGSKGNSTYIKSGNTAILVDQGFSAKEISRRMTEIGLDPTAITAIVLTHDHSDHAKGIGVFARKYKVPVCMTGLTRRILPDNILKNVKVQTFTSGDRFQIGDILIKSFHIPHDATDPVGLIVTGNGKSIAHITDIGKPIQSVIYQLKELDFDLIFLESNHDVVLLKNGPYPLKVQMRIKSRDGHLSNDESLELFQQLNQNGTLKHLVLAHLSEENNNRQLVKDLFFKFRQDRKHTYKITIADQHIPTEIFHL